MRVKANDNKPAEEYYLLLLEVENVLKKNEVDIGERVSCLTYAMFAYTGCTAVVGVRFR